MRDDRVIVATNDDGVYSLGLKLLYESVRDLGETIVLAPETPKSSSGLGLTLHKPLRIIKMHLWDNVPVYAINGTPSDIIQVAIHEVSGKPDIVVSGVNIGDNTSLQVILSSGTIGAAAQAALMGIPGIAFSAAIKSQDELEDPYYYEAIKRIVKAITRKVLEDGLPKNVDLISVNFPNEIGPETEVKTAPPSRIRFTEIIEKRVDPQGRPYYWVYGEPREPEKGTDTYIVLVEKNIAVTPLALRMTPCDESVYDRITPIVWEGRRAIRSLRRR